MKTFVINLDSRPDRMKHMLQVGDKLGLELIRIPAVKGTDLNPDKISVSSYVRTSLKLKQRFSKIHLTEHGEVGCFLSHRNVWEIIKDETEPCLVFEDDADPLPQAREWLDKAATSSFDFILLGIHEGNFVPEIKPLPKWTETGKLLTGSCAYIVSPRAAKQLYDASQTMDLSVDLFIPTIVDRIGYIHLFNQAFFWKRADILHVSDRPIQGIVISSMVAGALIMFIILFLYKSKWTIE